MNTFGSLNPSPLINWAIRLKTVAEGRKDLVAAKSIQKEVQELESGRFMLVVMGKVKRGKSTFCNAFLGRKDDQVAPVAMLPASCVISKFFWQETEGVKVNYCDGTVRDSSYEKIADFVTEKGNPENNKEVESLEIGGPFQGLGKQLVLVDTPGAGFNKLHDAVLYGFIPEADAVIFLVTADDPIGADELDLLKKLKEHEVKKVFFAINKVDECDEETDIQDGIDHNLKCLSSAGIPVSKIHRISAKQAMYGNYADSGVPTLLAEISTFLAESKAKVLRENFLSKINTISEGLAKSLAFEIASTSKTEEEIQTDLATLAEKKAGVAKDQEGVERTFKHEWKASTDDLEASLGKNEQDVKAKVHRFIEDYPILKMKQLSQELPGILVKSIEESMAEPVAQFESAAQNAVEKLEVDYPSLNLGETGDLVLKVGGHNTTMLKGVAGGAVAVAAGYGAMTAAAGVAASVAATNAAAAAAAASAVGAAHLAGVIGGIGTVGGALAGGPVGAAIIAGTHMLSTALGAGAAPVVLASAPVWIAFAGPVGWALIGVGGLVVPFAYRASKLKVKREFQDESEKQIHESFKFIEEKRIPQLCKLGDRILEKFAIKLANDLSEIERSLKSALERKKSLQGGDELQAFADRLGALIEESKAFSEEHATLDLH
jgi:GTPase Era involved in 16S rRNA processing